MIIEILYSDICHCVGVKVNKSNILIIRTYFSLNYQFKMAARVKAKQPAKKRQQRATSNIFAMFDQSQIQEFKEAFNIIDHDRVN